MPCDALLGAMGEGDIGHHFPIRTKGFAESAAWKFSDMYGRCLQKKMRGYHNVDVSVIAEARSCNRISSKMRAKIGSSLGAAMLPASTLRRRRTKDWARSVGARVWPVSRPP